MHVFLTALLMSAVVEDVRSHYADAVSAYQAGDGKAMLAATTQLIELRPDSPSLLYLHAAAHAMAEEDGAVELLSRLADMHLTLRAEQEGAFASQADNPDFMEVTNRFADNSKPLGEATIVATWPDGHFIPEQIAVHPEHGELLVGSVRKRTIVRMNPTGTPEFAAPGACGLMSAFGMHVRGDELLVATTGAKESPDTPPDQIGAAGIVMFDLDSGDCKRRMLLPTMEGVEHWLGDFAIVGEDLLATDSLSGRIWKLDADEKWSEILAPGTFSSPQGIVVNESGDAVFVADYTGGLYRFEPASGDVRYLQPAADMNTYGVDGLYRYGSWLIAIQNGHRPHKVTAFRLSEDETRLTDHQILASGLKEFDDPTLGDIYHDALYFVANSHWPSFDAEKNLPPAEELEGPIIMRIDLEGLR